MSRSLRVTASGLAFRLREQRGRESGDNPRPVKPQPGSPPRPAQPIPPITYPESLPVSTRREEIARAIAAHQVVIVCGETGSGKTTQLPKIVLELGRGLGAGGQGLIGHTQPRRIAASSVAKRIAQELNSPLGEWWASRCASRIGCSPAPASS
jgi:ATP-dependent helicase HrpA